ncbi:uncharacterized protein LOC117321466, partial [Pecten maximus]|uniref:uncharacterized protein LOC117321466 n=1 Tax=Pecten maximus TaxID=6579 RepID=UPI00145802FF
MATLSEKAVKHKRYYEDALQDSKIITGVLEIYEKEPEKLLKAKRAILHHICLDKDPTTKDGRYQVRKLVDTECDIPRHDDVFKFEEDQDNQDSTGGNSICEIEKGGTHSGTAPGAVIGAGMTPNTATPKTENLDKFHYKIGTEESKRLALYIGIRNFNKRREIVMDDRKTEYDPDMYRGNAEIMDRKESEIVLKDLGFTFKSNNVEKETTKEAIEVLIEKEINDAASRNVGIIIVMISSHGEEVLERSKNNKDENILRHRILLEDEFLYTDDLLNMFERKNQLKGIPKLFFIQACRSSKTSADKKDVDEGVEISVKARQPAETENDKMKNHTVALEKDESLPDATPRFPIALISPLPKNWQEPTVQSGPPAKAEDTELEVRLTKTGKIQSRPFGEQSIQAANVNTTKPPDETTVKTIPQLEEIQSISCIEDSLVMFGSAPGKTAFRDIHQGGWLMMPLHKSLKDWRSNPDQDLLQ